VLARHSRILPLLAAIAAAWLSDCAAAADAASPAAATVTPGQNQIHRSQAAKVLATRTDANSLVTAAALRFAGTSGKPRSKAVFADQQKSADLQKSALDLITLASEQAPQSAAIAWLHLQICIETPSCSTPEVATVMRWIDADNGAAWMPILATAQRDKDTVEITRVLDDMAQAPRFDLYLNRLTVVMFDALKTERHALPAEYAASDWARFTEVSGIATAEAIPSFTALAEVCRDLAAAPDRREVCLKLAKIMQKGDAVATQMAGFGIERRLVPADSKEARAVTERKRLLEWRVTAAAQFDLPLMPWAKNSRSRARLDQMRLRSREEDVCIAILREHKVATEPAEEHR
jgi:hypothetical protein